MTTTDTDTTPAAPTLTLEQVEHLADDLIRQLAEHPGDDEAVCDVLNRWLDVLDVSGLSLVALAALRTTYGECLTPYPEAIPANGLTITAPEENVA